MLGLLSSYAMLAFHLTINIHVSDAISDKVNSTCLKVSQFACNDGACISNTSRCDGFSDCPDSSDEWECELFHCLEPKWFRCRNGNCVSNSFVCDLENDCGDSSDEKDCNSRSVKTVQATMNCSSNEWKCDDGLCILKKWVCNGVKECLDGSDETVGCEEKFPCVGFKCKSGNCILSEWRCDNSRDCEDGSDEENCEFKPGCDLNEKLFHCANNKSCIKLSQVCDGIAQCSDYSDETSSCALTNVTCKDLHCSQDCVTLRYGSRCVCKDGYRVENIVNCTDVDECSIYGICDQKCQNVPGSYRCFCDQKYELQADGKTCKTDNGEALMIFSSKTQIRGYMLHSQVYFPIVKRLQQAIGVAYDKHFVYWTQIYGGKESIIRATQDGTRLQPVVTSGLGTPEDLAIDWITGNIYFTDTEIQHIAVCTNDGMYCTILVKRGIDKPRSIVLNPIDGEMYWSDWGKRPEIARASMDGSRDTAFVANEIVWPNGLALDRPNGRLYWTDAKLKTIESIKLDGTGRRVIFQGIVQHPYGLAVFEDKIYWSDWGTRSIESCDKFTGKNHHILLKRSKEIYGIHIFHSALQSYPRNPCEFTFCSDICLLNGRSYSCACPNGKFLDVDRHTCKDAFGKQKLVIGTKDKLWLLNYEELGKHNITEISTNLQNMTAIAYNDLNNALFIFDGSSRSLIEMKLPSGNVTHLPNENTLELITAMAFDNLGNNLYWCDSKKAVVEVLGLNTLFKKTLLGDMEGEVPVGIALVPEEGTMFIAFQASNYNIHIDRFNMNGKDRRHVVEKGLLGPLRLLYDYQLHRIYWADANAAKIESTSADGDDHHNFISLNDSPTAVASLKNKVLWSNSKSQLFWANKLGEDEAARRLLTELPENITIIHLLSVTPTTTKSHPCKLNNGNCSHICLVGFESAECQCPLGMKLRKNKTTCYKPTRCTFNEFFCQKSELCIPNYMQCNGINDCLFGEDEEKCHTTEAMPKCKDGYFQCKSGECIKNSFICDNYSDCRDSSDEYNCNLLSNQTKCGPNNPDCVKNCEGGFCNETIASCTSNEFKCKSGQCIPKQWECDQETDCRDTSDEHEDCDYDTCKPLRFQCRNGLCINKTLTCNKIDDCGDSSDETSCSTTNQIIECKENEFHCYKSNLQCLPFSVRCNGTSECPHHEDEQGCSDCHNDEYECENKKCISRHQVCDLKNDCGDNSDEGIDFCSHLKCKDDEFLCVKSNLQCFPMAVRCNGTSECPHHEDEQGCSNCHVDEFECDNKKCLPRHWVCNHVDDCGDNSDEDVTLCSHQQCQDYEIQCSNSNFQCLPILARCNGTSECPHSEDEQGCSFCHIDEFECKNKNCIPQQWVCDDSDDCGDNSDESMDFCSHKQNSTLQRSNENNFFCNQDFRCSNGRCVSMNSVCDGINNCGDDSDEHGACLEACSDNNNPCSQICKKTPAGPQCACGPGYRLRGDGHTCTDIKECSLDPSPCSQVCTEQPGSFTCSCNAGYVLRSDKRSCKSLQDMPMSIVFATSNEIYQLFPKNNNLEILYANDKLEISGIDASINNGFIYFITKKPATLNRIHILEHTREYMEVMGNPQYLTVDWVTQNLYFVTDGFTSKSIRICNFEAERCATVINVNINSKITALTVDSINKYLLYSVSSWKTTNSPSIIYKCRLDGSDLKLIYHSVNDLISGLTIDFHKQVLYYLDQHNGKINKVQYDGSNQMEVITNLTKPATLTTFDDHLHFYFPQGYLSSCPLFKDYRSCRSYKYYGHFNEKYIIFHSSRQPIIRNLCENNKCLYFCVPLEDNAQCLCSSDTIHNDGNYCQYVQVTKESYKKALIESKNKIQKGTNSALTVTMIIILCSATAAFTVYYYCYKKKAGNVTISMRFQNPIYGFIHDNSSQEVILQPGQHEYYNPLTAETDEIQTAKELNKTFVL